MRWPWQTREDPLIELLDEVLAQTRASREEHREILERLAALTPETDDDE